MDDKIETMSDKVARGAAEASALADDARSKVEDFGRRAGATAEQAYTQARGQVSGAAATIASSVEQQPLTALLVIGLLCGAVGYLLGRH